MSLRLKKEPWTPDEGEKLSNEEEKAAIVDLVRNVPAYRKLERGVVDPGIPNQCFALFSFVAAEQPNKFGLFGFSKIRGVFATEIEAREKCRKLISKFDSVNTIHIVRVGHPFPIGEKFNGEWDNVVLDEELQKAEEILRVKEEEREEEEKKFFENRKKELFEDVKKDKKSNTLEWYITLRQKYASMGALHDEYTKQLENIEKVAQTSYDEMREIEKSNPNVLLEFQEEYEKTRKACGLDKDSSKEGIVINQNFNIMPVYSFIKK
jgi:hypothetical protein